MTGIFHDIPDRTGYTKVADHQLLTAPPVLSFEIPTLQDVDADGSGVIDYTEFLAATLDRLMGSP